MQAASTDVISKKRSTPINFPFKVPEKQTASETHLIQIFGVDSLLLSGWRTVSNLTYNGN